jgi:hypothetical protein
MITDQIISALGDKNVRLAAIIVGVFFVLVGVYLVGVRAGALEADRVCERRRAPLLVEVHELTKQRDALSVKLTSTRAQCAANCAIDCESVCADEVVSALSDARAWSCVEL